MKKINENLTPEELFVLKDKGTERPFTGKFDSFFEDGIYKCKNCDAELFRSDSKYDACLLYTSPSPRDATLSRMPSSA